ncbi:unnamed protein product [Didymodactylos carnosus]|uniref:Uncharacterized protein n=1 Tax=Didymodactylos carnosus TaxID=1234261 RepID=A0A815JQ67_9BILA|nr:unnamed protein product [Didymodactylos carnosus]CAF1382037.1 unnamed protein product [Didymodactylos carnosus]CAF4079831.1 unnamed protein product [Didymodactylos carnosus]CAF4277370.1 unnamed protein product [Didymodactylos carnosus]
MTATGRSRYYGSTQENVAGMRCIDKENVGEIDLLYELSVIDAESELIPLQCSPGFVKVLWNGNHFLPSLADNDQCGHFCVNGTKVKDQLMLILQKLDKTSKVSDVMYKNLLGSASIQSRSMH